MQGTKHIKFAYKISAHAYIICWDAVCVRNVKNSPGNVSTAAVLAET